MQASRRATRQTGTCQEPPATSRLPTIKDIEGDGADFHAYQPTFKAPCATLASRYTVQLDRTPQRVNTPRHREEYHVVEERVHR